MNKTLTRIVVLVLIQCLALNGLEGWAAATLARPLEVPQPAALFASEALTLQPGVPFFGPHSRAKASWRLAQLAASLLLVTVVAGVPWGFARTPASLVAAQVTLARKSGGGSSPRKKRSKAASPPTIPEIVTGSGNRKEHMAHDLMDNPFPAILYFLRIKGPKSIEAVYGDLFRTVQQLSDELSIARRAFSLERTIDMDRKTIECHTAGKHPFLPLKVLDEEARLFERHFPGYKVMARAVWGPGAAISMQRNYDARIVAVKINRKDGTTRKVSADPATGRLRINRRDVTLLEIIQGARELESRQHARTTGLELDTNEALFPFGISELQLEGYVKKQAVPVNSARETGVLNLVRALPGILSLNEEEQAARRRLLKARLPPVIFMQRMIILMWVLQGSPDMPRKARLTMIKEYLNSGEVTLSESRLTMPQIATLMKPFADVFRAGVERPLRMAAYNAMQAVLARLHDAVAYDAEMPTEGQLALLVSPEWKPRIIDFTQRMIAVVFAAETEPKSLSPHSSGTSA